MAAIERVKNPILVAKQVGEKTDHSILAGSGAVNFARLVEFSDYDARTPKRIAEYRALRAKVPENDLKISQYSTGHPEHAHSSTMGTVGAIALDMHGHLATATTTGGMPLKLPVRLGDTLPTDLISSLKPERSRQSLVLLPFSPRTVLQ